MLCPKSPTRVRFHRHHATAEPAKTHTHARDHPTSQSVCRDAQVLQAPPAIPTARMSRSIASPGQAKRKLRCRRAASSSFATESLAVSATIPFLRRRDPSRRLAPPASSTSDLEATVAAAVIATAPAMTNSKFARFDLDPPCLKTATIATAPALAILRRSTVAVIRLCTAYL